ncbi:hypothetical protein C1X59_08465 [Pseudomonas sp. FW215-R2]|uniref:hypothetical protein n=1 Tax=unclassified Pseudomonas TaxID=196821 RepID=UPI000C88027C|nr:MULTISPECIES: hypothetical protein [unclassified Pseudomonas]PMX02344.1 hypothetical protein C1X59_08465 [Pseudomonas sp. FW215-R2]PMX11030.1 hypothetical protein C1X60_07755 [Pseudomonas sp. FW215-L1]PMX20785.1 hypothetical protein C1X57_19805 [Pseudomonas sp. FW215-E1]PNA21742.1 hypothetical protein C1X58_28165 [Pseudomonas sp. FW215-R4]
MTKLLDDIGNTGEIGNAVDIGEVSQDSTGTLTDYYEAIHRIVSGIPNIVPKGANLNLDNVALEAGRGKGSIKRGRPVYAKLIEEIRIRAGQVDGQKSPSSKALTEAKLSAQKARLKSKTFEGLYKDAIARELMLLRQIDELKKALLETGNVTPIRKQK